MVSTIDRTRRAPSDRSRDRLIALAAICIALVYLALALLSLALPETARRGFWLPVHLALAGGASTAIAGVMPFFIAAFAAAPPSGAVLRASGVAAVALGASGVTVGISSVTSPLAAGGGITFIAGIALVAAASLRPIVGSLAPSRGIVTRSYFVALAMIGVGAVLGTLYASGWSPILDAWSRLRPAHAWLNLVGFVSLVVAATLIHFFPTVVGARIGAHWSGRFVLIALPSGTGMVAVAYALELDPAVELGAAVAMAGALALVVYAFSVWASRARWTTDLDWHRFVIGGLASSIAWFAVGMLILVGNTLASGGAATGWSIEPIAGPLLVGWVGLAIVASATHLVPAVGPGDQAAHARQRGLLGAGASLKLVLLNAGVALLSIGLIVGEPRLSVLGVLVLGSALAASMTVLFRAITIGLSARQRRPAAGS